MKLDILVFAAHPDDAELSCSGTILSHIDRGKKVGIVDLTKGERGTRGTPEQRLKEAEHAAKILGVSVRENLGFKDVFFTNDEAHQLEVIKMIRKYRPEVILANAVSDRHPDHGKASALVKVANFMAGLRKIETNLDDDVQEPWRANAVYYYIQSIFIQPDLVVDISDFWNKKLESIRAFKTQFYDPDNISEPETYISSSGFLEFIEARAREYGQSIEVKYGEGFTVERNIGVKDIFDLI